MTKVLIVDDEPFTVDMLQTFLQINGYETVGALTGEDGIVLSQIESPDVLILDLMLPDLEGYDVCRRLRSFPPTSGLPVLILSARTSQVDKDKAIKAGANGYLTKPVQFPDLLGELTRLLTPIPPIPAPVPIPDAPPHVPDLPATPPTAPTPPIPNVPLPTPDLPPPGPSTPAPPPTMNGTSPKPDGSLGGH